jgi:hypothetical protein
VQNVCLAAVLAFEAERFLLPEIRTEYPRRDYVFDSGCVLDRSWVWINFDDFVAGVLSLGGVFVGQLLRPTDHLPVVF